MLFRNLQIYRIAKNCITREALNEQLGRLLFQPCGSQDLASSGFVPPVGSDLVHAVGKQWLIALGTEQRLLPASVVSQVAADRAEEIEVNQGFKPGRKQMKEIKEAVMQELLPRAFTQRKKLYCWINLEDGFLGIDAPSRTAAAPVIEALHKALDNFPLQMFNTEYAPVGAMTAWLAANKAPAGFTIDQDCELHSLTEEQSTVRYVRHSLEGDDIREHIAAGKKASKLALTFDDRISFVLTDRMEIKRLQPLDVLTEAQPEAQDAQEQFDADLALMTGELCRLIPALFEALGGLVLPESGDLVSAAEGDQQ
jgi:recombination associated protein RdgC